MERKVVLVGILVLLMASAAVATTNRIGTAGAQELRIPIGARGTGMAGAVIADVQGAEALFWNPAGVAWQKGTEVIIPTALSLLLAISDIFVKGISLTVQPI